VRILVLHRVPDSFVRYAENIDHGAHDVTYVSVPDRWGILPKDVRARFLERPGTGDTAVEVLAAVAGDPPPDLVIALSEYDLLPAARVRGALAAPGPGEAQVLPSRDKVVMKAAVAAAGLRTPRFLPLPAALPGDGLPGDGLPGDGGPASWSGPTVLKPLAAASSEGVRAFPTVAAALHAVRRDGVDASGALDIGDFEIEEFIEGPIIHVDGILAAGEPVAIQTSRYLGTCLGYAEGAPLGSVQVDTDPAVVAWAVRCLHATGIVDGSFHLEAIEAADGLVFMEVGARFGGADVVDTFELATGIRMPAVQLQLLLGGPDGPRPVPRVPGPDERYGWFTVPGHTLGAPFCRVSGVDEFRSDPLVRRWVQRAADEPIKQVITYADADIPLAGVVGPAPAEVLERFLTEMFAAVRVEPLSPAIP
jgi:hypothetical protein